MEKTWSVKKSVVISLFAGAFLFCSLSWAGEGGSGTAFSFDSLIEFLRGGIWKTVMEWLNLFVLLWLFWRYICPHIFRAIDDGIRDIELKLKEIEDYGSELKQKTVDLSQKIAGIDQEKAVILQEADQACEVIRTDMMQVTREQEMIIFEHMEKEASDYAFVRLNELKNELFGRLKNAVISDLDGRDSGDKAERFSASTLNRMENFS
jgi:F0F1-type ATP synthase membrane subunit b/b'